MIQLSAVGLRFVQSAIFVSYFGLAISAGIGLRAARAQSAEGDTVEGYVSAVQLPTELYVNGTQVTLTPKTRFGMIGDRAPRVDSPVRDLIEIGVYVKVEEVFDPSTKVITAGAIYLRDASGKRLSGMGLIDRIISTGPEPVLQADGYSIQIRSNTVQKFSGALTSLRDVHTNTWVRYEGDRDDTGMLVATRVEFSSLAKRTPKVPGKAKSPGKAKAQVAVPAQGTYLDADGEPRDIHSKVRLNQFEASCGWHVAPGDPAMQQRVLRVGTKLIPDYQSQMASDDPAKIPFRFYAVDEPGLRTDIFCKPGLVLVPKQAIERLQNDDQLAAVIADGIAFNMQRLSPKLNAEWLAVYGVELAGEAVSGISGGVFLGTEIGGQIAGHKILAEMEEQRGRVALTLLKDAGYDPWQAPEAWRLLAPKVLPKDLGSLKYPNRSEYQLGVLKLQYRADRKAVQEKTVAAASAQ
jgi:hypothetical protein